MCYSNLIAKYLGHSLTKDVWPCKALNIDQFNFQTLANFNPIYANIFHWSTCHFIGTVFLRTNSGAYFCKAKKIVN